MRVLVFSPYGSMTPESGVIYLVVNYLSRMFPEIYQLRCNGVCSLCDRDGEHNWQRDISSCLMCVRDQQELSDWSEIKMLELSRFIKPDQVIRSRRWVNGLPTESLTKAEYDGERVFDWCVSSFSARFGTPMPDLRNLNHEGVARRLMLSALRVRQACERLHQEVQPNLVFVAGGEDALSAALSAGCKKQGIGVVRFVWRISERLVQIHHPDRDDMLACEFFLDDVSAMRKDPETWSPELIKVLHEVLEFLGIDESQLALPLVSEAR